MIVALHPGALGDVLLAVPALRALRGGGEPLFLGAQPRIGTLLVDLGVVSRAASFDHLGLERLFVDDEDDTTPGLAALRDATTIVSWFGARDPVFVRRLGALAPGARVAPSIPPAGLVWRHLLRTIGEDDLDRWCAPVSVPESLRARGRHWLTTLGWDGATPIVLAQPGGGGAAKRWPTPAFVAALHEVARRGPAWIAIHRGPGDADAVVALRGALDGGAAIVEEPPLSVLAGICAEADLFVGNDSGVSHLAATVGVPAIVLFTPEHQRWQPWAPAAQVITLTPSATGAAGRLAMAVEAVLSRGHAARPA